MKEGPRDAKEKIRRQRKPPATTHGENTAKGMQEDTADQARGVLELTGKMGEVIDELYRKEASIEKLGRLIQDLSSEEKWRLTMLITQGRLSKKHDAGTARDIAREALELIPNQELDGYFNGMSDSERVKFCIFFIDVKTVVLDTQILKQMVAYVMGSIQLPAELAKVRMHPMTFMFFSPI